MVERFLSIRERSIRILATDAPALPWLILWPGLGEAAEEFSRLLREGPSQGWNVAAIDPPGHGQSGAWDSWDESSALTVWERVIETLTPATPPVLGGHSVGACWAIRMAAARPASVRAVVLLDGGYLDPLPADHDLARLHAQHVEYLHSQVYDSWERYLDAERSAAGSWDADTELMLRANMREQDGKILPRISVEIADQMAAALVAYRVDSLPPLTLPMLLAVATLPEELAEQREQGIRSLRSRAPNLQVTPIEHASHDLLVDNPAEVTRAVWAFLRTLT